LKKCYRVRWLNIQRRIIGRFLKFRIIGLGERFVIREQLEKHCNNVRVTESMY